MDSTINQNTIQRMNDLGASQTPFLFIIDFEGKEPIIHPLSELPSNIRFSTPWFAHHPLITKEFAKEIKFQKHPISLTTYQTAYSLVQHHLKRGDTYLLNLTKPTPIDCNISLETIFDQSNAPYRLLIDNKFVCFSPEIFIRINDGNISSFPMKGTIDANLPDAEKKLLNNPKETAEHNTIVDLIRNDLSMVAKKVRVAKYRYLDRVTTNTGSLFQMSSEITGQLPADFCANIGNILSKLLPAGSITGAPKQKTVNIIREAEQYDRGYYTGVFGVFDGKTLDSAVMIRFIEQTDGGLVYKSGGGITAQSDCEAEYNELIKKVYVPIT